MLNEWMGEAEINELPNGLHDAEISRIDYDLTASTLTFTVDVWIGNLSGETSPETYRPASLQFREVSFFTKSEPYTLDDAQLLFLDWTLQEDTDLRTRLDGKIAAKKCYSFYVYACTVEVVCDGVFLRWTGPASHRT